MKVICYDSCGTETTDFDDVIFICFSEDTSFDEKLEYFKQHFLDPTSLSEEDNIYVYANDYYLYYSLRKWILSTLFYNDAYITKIDPSIKNALLKNFKSIINELEKK